MSEIPEKKDQEDKATSWVFESDMEKKKITCQYEKVCFLVHECPTELGRVKEDSRITFVRSHLWDEMLIWPL